MNLTDAKRCLEINVVLFEVQVENNVCFIRNAFCRYLSKYASYHSFKSPLVNSNINENKDIYI